MSKIDFSEFTWFKAKPKNQFAITIPNQTILNINPKLLEVLPAFIEIGVRKAGTELCLREQPHSGYRILRSGAIKDKELLKYIVDSGVRLPARYTVLQEDDYWLAILDEWFPPKINAANPPKKPRTRNLKELLKESAAL